jgi:hypothetical protein
MEQFPKSEQLSENKHVFLCRFLTLQYWTDRRLLPYGNQIVMSSEQLTDLSDSWLTVEIEFYSPPIFRHYICTCDES